MSNDYGHAPAPSSPSRLKYGVLLFLLVFLLAGTLGHDPWWKRGEAYTFGIIYHFYNFGTWLVPVDAGSPFLEKPPLYYWTAVIFAHLFAGVLPLHDAARLASTFYTLITIVFTYKTGLQLFRSHANAKTLATANLALLLGTHGILQFSHALLTDNALVTGTSITLYALALLATQQEQWKKAGMWLGVGIGVAFLSKGFILPGILGISGLVMYAMRPSLRTAAVHKAIVVALFVASPFLLIWPLLLYHESPALFHEWFWDNNFGRFFGSTVSQYGAENDRGHFFELLLTFAFPSLPLAVYEIWRSRRNWRAIEYSLPFTVAFVGTFILFISASFRAPYLMPLVPAYALLATQALNSLPASLRRTTSGILLVAFSLLIVVAWLTWWSVSQPPAARHLAALPQFFQKSIAINYLPADTHYVELAVATIASFIWLTLLRYRKALLGNTAIVWLAGSMALWSVTHTLMMPWINENKSFRTILSRFEHYINQTPYKNACIGNYHMGENIPPMLQYFTGAVEDMPLMEPNQRTCPVMLSFAEISSSTDIDKDWHMIWRDSGFRDVKGMELRLYERK